MKNVICKLLIITIAVIALSIELSSCSMKNNQITANKNHPTVNINENRSVSPAEINNKDNLINIIETINGTIQKLPPRQYLKAVSFISPSIGYLSDELRSDTVVDANGGSDLEGMRLLKTADSGKTWRIINSGRNLYSLHFISDNTGFAIEKTKSGTTLIKTSDGGISWSEIKFPDDINLDCFNALDEKLLFAAVHTPQSETGFAIYKSINGGRNWGKIRPPFNDMGSNGVSGMSWISEYEGYILDNGQPGAGSQAKTLYYTRNGGVNWIVRSSDKIENGHMVSYGIPTSGYGNGIKFFANGTGYLGESRGTVYKSVDGGKNFKQTMAQNGDTCPVPDFINENEGYGIIHNRVLVHTDDGGMHWKRMLSSESYDHISFMSETEAASSMQSYDIDGELILDWTFDGGRTWTTTGSIPGDTVSKLLLIKGEVWAMVTDTHSGGFQVRLVKSSDRGKTWETVRRMSNTGGTFYLKDPLTIYIQDYESGLYKSIDGGKKWIQLSADEKVWNICFQDDSKGWALINRDVLAHSEDSGKSWVPVVVNGGKFVFNGIHMLAPEYLLIDCFVKNADRNKRAILFSDDGGQSFKSIVYPDETFDTLIPVTQDLLYAVNGSTLYKSNDGGRTFSMVSNG